MSLRQISTVMDQPGSWLSRSETILLLSKWQWINSKEAPCKTPGVWDGRSSRTARLVPSIQRLSHFTSRLKRSRVAVSSRLKNLFSSLAKSTYSSYIIGKLWDRLEILTLKTSTSTPSIHSQASTKTPSHSLLQVEIAHSTSSMSKLVRWMC